MHVMCAMSCVPCVRASTSRHQHATCPQQHRIRRPLRTAGTIGDGCVPIALCEVAPRAHVEAAEVTVQVKVSWSACARRIHNDCVVVTSVARGLAPGGCLVRNVPQPEGPAFVVATEAAPHPRGVDVNIVAAAAHHRWRCTQRPATLHKQVGLGVHLCPAIEFHGAF